MTTNQRHSNRGPDLSLAHNVLRTALTKLARDPNPQARRTAGQLTQEAINTLLRLAEHAEKATTAYKRTQTATRRTTPAGPQ